MKKKYQKIYDDLVEKIKGGDYPASSMLPSENKLADHYNTSRETIRKALNLLSYNGYIQKIRGKGSVVIDLNKFSFPVSGIVSFQELNEDLHLSSRTIVEKLAYLDDAEEISTILRSGTENVWQVNRVREISGERIILDKDYFTERFVPKLSKAICERSIYQYIEEELGLPIAFGQKEMVVEAPTPEDRTLLDMEGFSSIVVIRSHVYLDDTSLFQYSESRHRPDKFRFVDFARRVTN
ncbi:GntR family transcriptional regulator, trehalose operon transcriptional repressor [Lentibacillus persicus]|uniref:Trehalose operon repressor n=1 Tax=Lentibacillus persicus TaxID=640948 RepID=A0A1I1W0T4_9BACI|nr:trehalose operon repressor [Lentibacillus persicus]SFD88619.1 GntR family transcriptional regulator, trehalose operon transcriptional repressor [Lentibacillus persicus]